MVLKRNFLVLRVLLLFYFRNLVTTKNSTIHYTQKEISFVYLKNKINEFIQFVKRHFTVSDFRLCFDPRLHRTRALSESFRRQLLGRRRWNATPPTYHYMVATNKTGPLFIYSLQRRPVVSVRDKNTKLNAFAVANLLDCLLLCEGMKVCGTWKKIEIVCDCLGGSNSWPSRVTFLDFCDGKYKLFCYLDIRFIEYYTTQKL